MGRRIIVGVMGSGKEEWEPFSTLLGRLIGELQLDLLTGSGKGTMTAVARAFCNVEDRSGISIGVVPCIQLNDGTFEVKEGYPNDWVELAISGPLGTYDGLDDAVPTRNHINIMTSDLLIFLPGNKGTANELRLALKFNKPVIYFGPLDHAPAETPNRSEHIEDIRKFLLDCIR